MNMKNLKVLLTLFLAVAFAISCSDDDNSLDALQNAPEPSNISALFTITQDNSGLVTILPNGENVTGYNVYFGDGTTEPASVRPGNRTTHVYAEGEYQVRIVGYTVNGKTSEYIHDLTVSFREPENLEMSVTPVTGDSFSINVTASADYEAYFEVIYGEDPAQEPVQFNQGQSVTHTYSSIGTYTVTVTAFSGGAATSTLTQTVTITNPLLLPIDFESPTLNYAFGNFGGAVASVIDNPDATGLNPSAKVGRFTKTAGAEVWAGTAITLDGTIDFASMQNFRVKVWSPQAGIPVLLKVENLTDANINHEVQQVTTVANQWEYLTFNFQGVNQGQSYSKVILFFNFGVNGGGENYYFDDISLFAGDAGVGLPLTFESPTLTYTFNDFGGAFGAKVANPNPSGINISANVGRVIKNSGAEVWAGIAMPMAGPIDFSVDKKIKMKVFSPAAGRPVLMKLESIPNVPAAAIEIQAVTTVANAWEELTFDFTGINNANNYQMIVLFFDFGNVGNGATYYFDDIQQFN